MMMKPMPPPSHRKAVLMMYLLLALFTTTIGVYAHKSKYSSRSSRSSKSGKGGGKGKGSGKGSSKGKGKGEGGTRIIDPSTPPSSPSPTSAPSPSPISPTSVPCNDEAISGTNIVIEIDVIVGVDASCTISDFATINANVILQDGSSVTISSGAIVSGDIIAIGVSGFGGGIYVLQDGIVSGGISIRNSTLEGGLSVLSDDPPQSDPTTPTRKLSQPPNVFGDLIVEGSILQGEGILMRNSAVGGTIDIRESALAGLYIGGASTAVVDLGSVSLTKVLVTDDIYLEVNSIQTILLEDSTIEGTVSLDVGQIYGDTRIEELFVAGTQGVSLFFEKASDIILQDSLIDGYSFIVASEAGNVFLSQVMTSGILVAIQESGDFVVKDVNGGESVSAAVGIAQTVYMARVTAELVSVSGTHQGSIELQDVSSVQHELLIEIETVEGSVLLNRCSGNNGIVITGVNMGDLTMAGCTTYSSGGIEIDLDTAKSIRMEDCLGESVSAAVGIAQTVYMARVTAELVSVSGTHQGSIELQDVSSVQHELLIEIETVEGSVLLNRCSGNNGIVITGVNMGDLTMAGCTTYSSGGIKIDLDTAKSIRMEDCLVTAGAIFLDGITVEKDITLQGTRVEQTPSATFNIETCTANSLAMKELHVEGDASVESIVVAQNIEIADSTVIGTLGIRRCTVGRALILTNNTVGKLVRKQNDVPR